MDFRSKYDRFRSMDWVLFLAVVTLLFFGLAAIYSVALSKGGDFFSFKKHALAVVGSLLCCLVVAGSNYRLLRNYSVVLYIGGVLLLGAVLLFGSTIRGTRGWFAFPLLSIQPVEFVKIISVIVLAQYFSVRARRRMGWREVIESGALALVPIFLVLLQPDFGSASLLLMGWLSLLFFAGLRRSQILALLGTAVAVGWGGWLWYLQDYQKARILTFLDPTADPLGQGYHSHQAMIAVGSGGWIGRGLGFGSQSQLKFLPEAQTDFIFAVIAEELGFVGVALVLAAFGVLFLRIFQHARKASDPFTCFLLVGIGTILFTQFFINVGMNLGVLPVTGLALPLVSYGGSSLLATLLMVGIVESAAFMLRSK